MNAEQTTGRKNRFAVMIPAIALLGLAVLTPMPAQGYQDGIWGVTAGSNWNNSANWVDGLIADGAGATAKITNTIAVACAITNDVARSIGILNIGSLVGNIAYTISSQPLTFDNLGASAQINCIAVRACTISAPVLLNDSLDVSVSLGTATYFLTLSGGISATSAGRKTISHVGAGALTFTISGAISDGSAGGTIALVQNSATSATTLSGVNTYTGPTTNTLGLINLSTVYALPGGIGVSGGTSALTINGGVIGLGYNNFSRGLGTGVDQVQWTGDGGFTAITADRTVNLGGASAQVTWGSGSFMCGTLILSTNTSAYTVDFQNPIDLNSAVRTVQVHSSTVSEINAKLSGVLSGSGGLTKTGVGSLVLTGANTYSGKTTIGAGTLRVSSLNSVASPTPSASSSLGKPDSTDNGTIDLGAVAVTGTLLYTGVGETSDRVINLAGTTGAGYIQNDGSGAIIFTSALTATGAGAKVLYLQGSNTAESIISNKIVNSSSAATSLTKSGAGKWVLSGANEQTGATIINGGGTLVLDYSVQDNSKLADAAALTLSGGTLTLRGGSHTEVVSAVTLNTTGSFVTRSSGDSVLRMNVITRAVGGTIDFGAASIADTDTLNINGILGGWATVAGTDWAMNSIDDVNGPITAYAGYTVGLPDDTGDSTINYSHSGDKTISGAVLANTLKLANSGDSQELALGANNLTFTWTSATSLGGLLYVGGNDNLYTISGSGIIGAGATGEFIVNVNTGTLTISAPIIGAGGGSLTKTGSGKLVLSTASSYTGVTRINQGVVNFQKNSVAGGTTNSITVVSGAALELQGGYNVGGGLTNNTLSLTGTGIANGGALRNISGNNTYGGTITLGVNGARINCDADFLSITGGVSTAIFRDLTIGGEGNVTNRIVVISGAGKLIKDGGGTLTLSVANTFTGGTTIRAGTVTLGIAAGLGQTATAMLDFSADSNAKFQLNKFTQTIVRLSGDSTATIENGGDTTTSVLTVANPNDCTFDGLLQNGAGSGLLSLTKSGIGTLTLSNVNNTYTGVTTISGGVLSVASLANGGVACNIGAAAVAAANLVLGGGTLQYTGGTVTIDRSYTLTAATTSMIEITEAGTTLTISGASTATTGALTKTGAGTLVLSGLNLATGTTRVSAGTLAYGINNALATGAVTVNGTNAVLAIGGYNDSVGLVTLTAGAITGTGGALTSTVPFMINGDVDTLVTANLAGAVGLNKSGTGTNTLGAVSTYSGDTTISNGMLKIGVANAIPVGAGNGNVSMTAGATLNVAFDCAINGLSGTGTVDNASGTAARILTVGSNDQSSAFSGVIQNSGGYSLGLTKVGSGTLELLGTNTFTGPAAVSGGILRINGSLAAATAVTVQNGGTLSGTGRASGAGGSTTVESGGTIAVGVSGAGVGIMTNGALALQSGSISIFEFIADGANDQIDASAGALTINSGDKIYLYQDDTTTTFVTPGTYNLIKHNGTVIGDPSALIVQDRPPGALYTFDDNGTYLRVTITTALSKTWDCNGAAGVNPEDGSGTWDTTLPNWWTGAANTTWNNAPPDLAIIGAGGTAGTITLDTGITAASLTFETVSGSYTVAANTLTLLYESHITVNAVAAEISSIIAGTTIIKAGAGMLTLSGANTFSGALMLDAGTLNINNAQALGAVGAVFTIRGADGACTIDATSGPITIGNNPQAWNADFTFTGANNLTFGTGAITLNGNRTVTVVANTLTEGGAITGAGFNLTKDGAGTLVLGGIVGTTTGGVEVDGGTLTLSGANTYSGNTTVTNTGTLKLGASDVIPNGAGKGNVNLALAGAILNLNGYNETINGLTGVLASVVDNTAGTASILTAGDNDVTSTFNGIIQNTGATLGLTKTGTGTLTLAGANTFTGGLVIKAGTVIGTTSATAFGSGTITIGDSSGSANATLQIGTTSLTFSNPISVAAGNTGLATITPSGNYTVTFTGPVTLNSHALTLISVTTRVLTLSGGITGTGDVLISGTGTTGYVLLSGASVNNAGSIINQSTISTGTSLISGGVGANVTNITQNSTTSALTVSGALTVNSGRTTLINTAGTKVLTVSGGTTGTGDLVLNNNSATADGITVTNAAVNNTGMIINSGSGSGSVTIFSSIGALVTGVTQDSATSLLTLSGTEDNTYTTATTVNAGELDLNKTAGVNAIAGALVIGDGTGGANADIVKLMAANQINNTAAVTINSSGKFDLNDFAETIGSLADAGAGGGNVNLGSATLTFGDGTATLTFSGVIAGTGALTKQGTGTEIFSGANTYSGSTIVSAGTLLVSGSLDGAGQVIATNNGTLFVNGSLNGAGQVTATSGGTLGGTGTVAGAVSINAGGTNAPGLNSIGTLTVNNGLTFNGGKFVVKVTTTNSGDYGQVKVTGGNVQITSGPLDISGLGYTPADNDYLWIINNTGGGTTAGNFDGLPEGAQLTITNKAFNIYYNANLAAGETTGGNDVLLVSKTGPANQTINNFTPADGSVFVPTSKVGLAAQADSGLTVTFGVDSGPCSITGTNLTFTDAGAVRIKASQAGNANWNPAPDVTNAYVVYYAANQTNSIPWHDNFETYSNLTPLVNGINGWYGSSTGIIVQQEVKMPGAGLQAAMVPEDCALSNQFMPQSPTNVWIQLDMRQSLFDGTNNPVVDTSQALILYVNTNGNFVFYNSVVADWVTASNFNVGTEGTNWVTLGIYADFNMRRWHLYASNAITPLTLVTNNIMFINQSLTNFNGFSIYNGSATSYLDNASVTASNKANVLTVAPAGFFTVSNKVYDANTRAAISNSSLTLVNPPEGVTLTAVAVFDTKDAGTNKLVNLTGSGLAGTNAVNYTLSLAGAPTATGEITKATFTAALVSTTTKTYDHATVATLVPANYVLSGLIGSETSAVNQTVGAYATINVGSSIAVSATLTAANFSEVAGGFNASNYMLPITATGNIGAITARAITVAAAASSKPYDGGTSSEGTPVITVGDLAVGDTGNWTQSYANKDVGTDKLMIPNGTVSDGNGGANYAVTFSNMLVGIITRKTLTLGGSFQVSNKAHDGTTAATITNNSLTIIGVVVPDVVEPLNAVAVFDNANVGIGKTVFLTGSTLAGSDAGNYTLDTTSPTANADITINSQTITFPAIPAQPFANGTLTLDATASSGLPVTFTKISGPGTISGNLLTFSGVGEFIVTASQPGDGNWLPAATLTNTFPIYGFNPTTNTIPWSDNFENYFNLEPLINGTNGWYGDSSDIIVQTIIVAAGSKAAKIPFDCTLYNRFVSTTPTNVWVQMDVRPILYDGVTNMIVDTNVAVMFYVNSNGNFVVHNGIATNAAALPDPTNSVNWVVATNNVTIPTNALTWVRVNVYQDFARSNWNLYSDGVLVTNNIGFINPNLTNFTGFDVCNGSMTAYLDNVSVIAMATNEVTQLQLIVVPSALSQSFYAGALEDVIPLVQTVKVINVWSTDIGFQVRTNQNWITALPTNGTVTHGTTQDVVLTYANIKGWGAGASNATVTVVATNGTAYWGTQTVQVVLNMLVFSNCFSVTPTQFSNNVWKGATPPNRTVAVQNLGGASFDYTVVTGQYWIASVPSIGALSAYAATDLTLTNTEDTAGWTAGDTRNTWVDVVASNSGILLTQRVSVAVNVLAFSNVFTVTPTFLSTTAWIGDTPTNRTFVVNNMSDVSFDYGVRTTADWIAASTTGGTVAAQGMSTVTLTYASTWGWMAGQSNATAIVSSANGGGLTQNVAVTLNVTLPAMNYYVATSGGNVFPYTNWPNAARALTAAVNKANFYTNAGSVVWISNGVYNLPNQVTLSNVTVRGLNGAGSVTLNGGIFRGFYLAHTGAALNGLTITNCNAGIGTNGGAVFVSTGLVMNCRLLGNSATNGGGVAVGAGGVVRDCLIWGNTASNGGGVYYDMANSISGPSGLVESCTIASNYAITFGGGLYTATNMTGLCVNAVVYQNLVESGVYSNWGTNVKARLVFTNCCLSPTNGVYGTNNIANAPGFVNVMNGDCRLTNGSPCINAGTNQAWMVDALDLAGSARIRFGRVDIGAYEWYQYQGMVLKVNGVPYERIRLINGVEPLWINGITNSSSAR